MNEAQKLFCDGAAMAYRDCGNKIADMIKRAPPEIKHLMEHLRPMSDAMLAKADEVYKEAERFTGGRH